MSNYSPIVCRKCGIYPKIETVMLDGMWQRKCHCEKCGLAIYTPQGVAIDAVERWNAVNKDERIRFRPGSRSRKKLVTGETALFGDAYKAPATLASLFDDEDYNPFSDHDYLY